MNIQPNFTQQIPTRIFRVNHLGGFAILQNIEPMTWIIENTNIVTVAEVSSVGQAYVDACNQYSRDTWRKNPYTQPIVPKFDDMPHAVSNSGFYCANKYQQIFRHR